MQLQWVFGNTRSRDCVNHVEKAAKAPFFGALQERPGAKKDRPGVEQERPGTEQERPGAKQSPGAEQERPGSRINVRETRSRAAGTRINTRKTKNRAGETKVLLTRVCLPPNCASPHSFILVALARVWLSLVLLPRLSVLGVVLARGSSFWFC